MCQVQFWHLVSVLNTLLLVRYKLSELGHEWLPWHSHSWLCSSDLPSIPCPPFVCYSYPPCAWMNSPSTYLPNSSPSALSIDAMPPAFFFSTVSQATLKTLRFPSCPHSCAETNYSSSTMPGSCQRDCLAIASTPAHKRNLLRARRN